jgi:hypothetical protein
MTCRLLQRWQSFFVCIKCTHAKFKNLQLECRNEPVVDSGSRYFLRTDIFEIGSGNELAVLEHPSQAKHPGQRISMVQVDDYVYAVPFVETHTEIFLKTIVPSRKATRQYRSKV